MSLSYAIFLISFLSKLMISAILYLSIQIKHTDIDLSYIKTLFELFTYYAVRHNTLHYLRIESPH